MAKKKIEAVIESNELENFEATNIFTEEESSAFLPEVTNEEVDLLASTESVEGTELDAYDSAEIVETEFMEEERLDSIIESILFASDRPVSLLSIKQVFKGTQIRMEHLRRALDRLATELAGARRGVSLEEVPGGYQLRTKLDNIEFLKRTLKARPFKLSGPALEVMAIVAYKQPIIKSEIDEIRGVESGHLLRALMEKGLVNFEGKSELPGKPMLYATTKKFLEIFGLRNLKELPTLSQIDELLPEGIAEIEAERQTLSELTGKLSETVGMSYSESEEELQKIAGDLENITTSSDFFEQEKQMQRQKREAERAQGIREAMLVGEAVATRDKNWLEKYDLAMQAGNVNEFLKSEEKETQALEKFEQTMLEKESINFESNDENSADSDLNVDLHDDEDREGDINA